MNDHRTGAASFMPIIRRPGPGLAPPPPRASAADGRAATGGRCRAIFFSSPPQYFKHARARARTGTVPVPLIACATKCAIRRSSAKTWPARGGRRAWIVGMASPPSGIGNTG
ncbi:hypothetical protein [Burkholderia plantarii]|uniref:hypothetical protein n=1 Tax=Burkholderia plantarii TaxID=41899 RepID=UPI0018DEC774|nr:hypothetical protein [Burkholderia plantarii]MBI0328302.1 hypothetical protein [Burkholderia plantarii]